MSMRFAIVLLSLTPILAASEPTLISRLGDDRFRQKARVEAIAYSADGKQLATADGKGLGIHIWNAGDGRLIRTLFADDKHQFIALRFAPDGKSLHAAAIHGIGFFSYRL